LFTYYQQQYPNSHLEITEEVAKRELTLPLYPGMTTDMVYIVVYALKDALS
jgi:dTDP-4-amino-4,6-dideoxygalactose transaminase